MEHSIDRIQRPVRRRLKRVMQTSKDIKHARRAQAILLLYDYGEVSLVARLMRAGRSAIQSWKQRFEQFGEAGMVPEPQERKITTTTEEVGRISCPSLRAIPGLRLFARPLVQRDAGRTGTPGPGETDPCLHGTTLAAATGGSLEPGTPNVVPSGPAKIPQNEGDKPRPDQSEPHASGVVRRRSRY